MYSIQPPTIFNAKFNAPFNFKQDASSGFTTLGFFSSETTNSTIMTPGYNN